MGHKLTIEKIIKSNNRISYEYKKEGKWNELLMNKEMFIEYDVNIEDVPNSICIIPLLCNILPISWVYDIDIDVNELDKEFYENIDKIKKGYIDMYPMFNFKGNIVVKKLLENKYAANGSGVLFSGGVDAFNTLIQHIDEKPSLITIWGSDISLDDKIGWDTVNNHHNETATNLGLDYHYIKTNFRTFINCRSLSDYVSKKVVGEWWHEFQHGIGLIGLTAPLAYIKKYKTVYIASSFTAEDKGKYTCASDPTIDNYLIHSSCKTIHDGYEFNRQDKIHNICNYVSKTNQKIKLRVCWQSIGGKNCCMCEKCCRTMLGILTEKNDPNLFGFNFNTKIRKKMMKTLKPYVKYNHSRQYSEMQRQFIENYKNDTIPKDLIWFKNIKIVDKKPTLVKLKDKVISIPKRAYRKIKRIIKRQGK